MSKLVIANFKMNGSKEFIENWVKDFHEENESNKTIIVALPSPYLSNFKDSNFNLVAKGNSFSISCLYSNHINIVSILI